MAGSFPLLLLAVLVPAAVATVAVGLQPAAPCEPALTAWEISRVCSAGRPTARCCGRVMAVVELGGGVPCLCRVAALPELAMAGLDVKRLFTSCGGARLTAACEVPPKTMGSPPPAASPAVGTLSPPAAASPAVGTLSAHPSKERDTTPAPSNDHAILVAILVLLVIFGFVACTGGAVYLIFKVKARGGWMLLGRARANEQQQPNIIIVNDAAQPEASASTSASASDALSTVVNNVMRHTAELQKHLRRSGRLAGMEPTHSGLQ